MSSGNDPHASIEYWSALQKLGRDLTTDRELTEQFRADPAKVIKQRNLDQPLKVPGRSATSFADLFGEMSEQERSASIAALKTISGIDLPNNLARPLLPIAIANANVVANVNAAANHEALANSAAASNLIAAANANTAANANANTSGDDGPGDDGPGDGGDGGDGGGGGEFAAVRRPLSLASVQLPESFGGSDFARKMNELEIIPARQQALLKRALTDDDSVYERTQTDLGEYRKARYSFRGHVFDVVGVVTPKALTVLEVTLLPQ
jgi:hypothetical protein